MVVATEYASKATHIIFIPPSTLFSVEAHDCGCNFPDLSPGP